MESYFVFKVDKRVRIELLVVSNLTLTEWRTVNVDQYIYFDVLTLMIV